MIKRLHRFFVSHQINSASVRLAAARENLADLESHYRDEYPTDDTVSKILIARMDVKDLQEHLMALRAKMDSLSN